MLFVVETTTTSIVTYNHSNNRNKINTSVVHKKAVKNPNAGAVAAQILCVFLNPRVLKLDKKKKKTFQPF